MRSGCGGWPSAWFTTRIRRIERDGLFAIEAVRPGSPAEKAGLAAGDLFLAVDGRDVQGIGPGALNHLMGRKPGAPVTLTVQSPSGDPRKVTLTAVKQSSP